MEFSRRKWGYYLTLYSANHFKIKLLWFRKGGQCSMQKHFKRSEQWLFLYGAGEMKYSPYSNYGIKIFNDGEIANVPMQSWHQFTAYKTTLVLEIQTGICEESDIERAA